MSRSDLTEVALPDLVSFIVDNRGRTCPVVDEGFPLIATNSVIDGSRRVVPKDVRYVDDETYRTWFRAHPEPNDVLFVCKGTPGKVALVPDPVPYCIAQDMVALRANPETADPTYLYYRLSASDVREAIEGLHVGSLIPHFKKGDFNKLRFKVHSLAEQRRIAAVLSSLDDLIENHRQAIAASRALAVAALDAASVGGDVVPFAEVAHLVRDGVAPGDLERGTLYLGLENFGLDGEGIISVGDAGNVASNKTRFACGDVLYGKLRPYFRKHDRPGFGGVCTTEIWVLRPQGAWGGATLNAIVARPDFTEFSMAGSGGTKMPRANWDHVRRMPVRVPRESHRLDLDDQLEALWRAQVGLANEVSDLTHTRDELLPLLVSGAIRVTPSLDVA